MHNIATLVVHRDGAALSPLVGTQDRAHQVSICVQMRAGNELDSPTMDDTSGVKGDELLVRAIQTRDKRCNPSLLGFISMAKATPIRAIQAPCEIT